MWICVFIIHVLYFTIIRRTYWAVRTFLYLLIYIFLMSVWVCECMCCVSECCSLCANPMPPLLLCHLCSWHGSLVSVMKRNPPTLHTHTYTHFSLFMSSPCLSLQQSVPPSTLSLYPQMTLLHCKLLSTNTQLTCTHINSQTTDLSQVSLLFKHPPELHLLWIRLTCYWFLLNRASQRVAS